MIPVPQLIQARCSFCSKERPEWRVHRIASGQVICDYCLDQHFQALDFLAGAMPRACHECGRSWQAIRDSSPAVEIAVGMYVVPKDGILQVLCAACKDAYVALRSDLYKGTKFGEELLHR